MTTTKAIFTPNNISEPEVIVDLTPLAEEISLEEELSETVVIPRAWLAVLREESRK